jgi:hypothetical protein
MTLSEKEIILKSIFWDYNITGKELYSMLVGDITGNFPGKEKIFIRMLERLGWYDILNIAGYNLVKELLTKEL